MSEKYFAYLAVFLIVAAIVILIAVLRWQMRLKYLQNLTRVNILKRQQKSDYNTFFAAEIINQSVKILYGRFNPNARKALTALIAGRTERAAEYLSARHPLLAPLLSAHTRPDTAYRQIFCRKKQYLSEPQYGVYLPILAHLMYDRKTAEIAVNKLSAFFAKSANSVTAAYYRYISSYIYLFEGEMLSASQTASAAQKFFQKKQYAIETAACHLALAEIYRISCVNDVAETMIDSAVKIYQTQKTPLFEAKAVVAKGMLMVFENRCDEAAALYEKALQMPITEQLRADIYNQQALLFLALNRLRDAQRKANNSLKIQQKLKNKHGTAFSLQLMAQTAFREHRYRTAVKNAEQAAALYLAQSNPSAYAECLYLIAGAHYRQNRLEKSEKILRSLLDLSRRTQLSFHIANAYSLLGLIYMQKQDLQRAKVLFQQSLHLEQSKQRCEGMVADYANLALIEELTDNPENAVSNWQIALEYARQTGDAELQDLIEKHYNKNI